jgi:hypothetical protein
MRFRENNRILKIIDGGIGIPPYKSTNYPSDWGVVEVLSLSASMWEWAKEWQMELASHLAFETVSV